ncbi:hypothetical protein M514_04627, partial [Trichuris suis]
WQNACLEVLVQPRNRQRLKRFPRQRLAGALKSIDMSLRISNSTYLLLKNFLQCMGFCYTEEQILKAELRVLKALDYDVNIQSPLTYLSILLKLVTADVQLSNFQSISNICLDILSFVFMKRDEIYGSLLLDPISEQERKHQIVVLEADCMLLACGVITSAVDLNDDQCNEHSTLLSLSNRSAIPVEELKHFRANVKKCVIKSKQTVRTQETTHRRSTPSCKY